MSPRRGWPGRQVVTSDLVLAAAALGLEVGIELHSVDMGWSLPILFMRIPVLLAVLLLRRRQPLLAMFLAVADVAVQGQVSAAVPIAAYALTAYQPRWSMRIPALVIASGVVLAGISGDWELQPIARTGSGGRLPARSRLRSRATSAPAAAVEQGAPGSARAGSRSDRSCRHSARPDRQPRR